MVRARGEDNRLLGKPPLLHKRVFVDRLDDVLRHDLVNRFGGDIVRLPLQAVGHVQNGGHGQIKKLPRSTVLEQFRDTGARLDRK